MKKNPKEKIVTFRLDKHWAGLLNDLSTRKNKNKSDIFRNALMLYYFITNDDDPRIQNTIMNQNVLKFLYDNIPEEKIDDLALISYKDGISSFENLKHVNIDLIKNIKRTPENMIKLLSEFIFPPDKQRWFEEVEYSIEENKIIFSGKHLLGRNFFIFIKELLKLYFKDYNYELINEKHEEIKQYLKSRNKEEITRVIFSLTLEFSKIKSKD